jgi:hypothetical protein
MVPMPDPGIAAFVSDSAATIILSVANRSLLMGPFDRLIGQSTDIFGHNQSAWIVNNRAGSALR